jgi:hypothetical protein
MAGYATGKGYWAFEGEERIAEGDLAAVVLQVKRRLGKADRGSALIFSEATGATVDFNFHGSEKDVLKRLEVFTSEPEPTESAGPGRPRLGVVSREISLLPRQWEWLATQPGGASGMIRKLVDEAKRKASDSPTLKQLQERAYKFMSVMAGDRPGYEEALRCLYKKDRKGFLERSAAWPKDVRDAARRLADAAFAGPGN